MWRSASGRISLRGDLRRAHLPLQSVGSEDDWENVTGSSGLPVPPPPAPPEGTRLDDVETWRNSRWGIGDAVWGWLVAVVLGAVVGALIIAAAGFAGDDQSSWPLWLVAVTQVPLWSGLLGAPLMAAWRSRSTVIREFGLRFEAIDVPVGLAIGIAAQFVLVPAISWPWLQLLGKSSEDLSRSAEQLVSKANDPLGVVLLVAIVVIGAPFIEELFYRGLVLRSLQKIAPDWAAIVGCGFIFGASHFQILGLPALAAFGMVLAFIAFRTRRLGMAISAHLAFNAVTVWYLLR